MNLWILDALRDRKNSEDVAIVLREESISFKELWDISEKIAHWIIANCNTKNPIIIYGNKEVEIVAIMVAALKTGRAYVPIDITYPEKRVQDIANETRAEAIFTFCETKEIKNITNLVDKKQLQNILNIKLKSEIDQANYVSEKDDCYILFTSGSTGKPKGVPINKKNILNFVEWFGKKVAATNEKYIVLNQAAYSFDLSVIPLHVFLPQGHTLYCVDKLMMDNLSDLFKYFEKSNMNVWVSTPTFLEVCSFDDSFNENMLPKLSKFIFSGEVLTKELVKTINSKFKDPTVINAYGPTEGTVSISACEINDEMLTDNESLPIGTFINDLKYKIVDENGVEVKNENVGELVVVSDSISRGYFNNPLQTQKSFFEDESGKNGYKTGDLVFEKNGFFYYVARKDTQVKLNGYRIELTDISNNLNNIKGVSNSVVLPSYKNDKVTSLAAFVVLKEKNHNISKTKQGIELKKELAKLIPAYMIPRRVVILDEFPMNTNNKIDRKKLSEDYL